MRQTLKDYIESKVQVRYQEDGGEEVGLFSDIYNEDRMIMGYNEKYLMKIIVDTIVKPYGSLLNIGYGLGYFDKWSKLGVNSHHIIECHPDVIKILMRMVGNVISYNSRGYMAKCNTKDD